MTNNLALAYESYRNNLYSMDYYRRNILPDLVRYYRGIYDRRQNDPAYMASAFGDLVFAQQNLTTNVQTYLGLLQSLWTSVVGVADLLQTDDLYQLGKRHELPQLPDFNVLQPPHWECGHETVAAATFANHDDVNGPRTADHYSTVWAGPPRSPARGRALLKDDGVQIVALTQDQPGASDRGARSRSCNFRSHRGCRGRRHRRSCYREMRPREARGRRAFIRTCRRCRSSRNRSRGPEASRTRWPISSEWPRPTARRCARPPPMSRRPRAT